MTKRSIEKFKNLYLKIFGTELTDQETQRKAEKLLEIYRVIFELPQIENSNGDKEVDILNEEKLLEN